MHQSYKLQDLLLQYLTEISLQPQINGSRTKKAVKYGVLAGIGRPTWVVQTHLKVHLELLVQMGCM